MTIRILQSESRRATKAEVRALMAQLAPNFYFSNQTDLSEYGLPFLEEVEKPQAQEGYRVVAGPDEEYEPGKWRMTWVQQPIPDEFKNQFSPLEFLERFTPEEQLAITQASMQSPQLRLWYDKMLAARDVALDDPRLEAGLQALVDAALLTGPRKDELKKPEKLARGNGSR